MLFKNLFVFTFEKPLGLTMESLAEELGKNAYADCGSTQRERFTWVSPFGRKGQELLLSQGGCALLSMAKHERLLPNSVVADELKARVQKIEDEEGRRASNLEKKALREDIEFELLPRAFVRTTVVRAMVSKEWLIVDTASPQRAEEFTKLLRKTLGSLPVSLVSTETTPAVALTSWVSGAKMPKSFTLGFESTLSDQGDSSGKARFTQQDLTSDEVQVSLQHGKYAKELALNWQDKLDFVLTDDFVFKKVKPTDLLVEAVEEQDPQSHAEALQIEFALAQGEIRAMLKDLTGALGGLA